MQQGEGSVKEGDGERRVQRVSEGERECSEEREAQCVAAGRREGESR